LKSVNKVKKPGSLDAHRNAAAILCPELRPIILHQSGVSKSTWETGVETGKSVEFLSVCGLIAAAKVLGFEVTFPDIYSHNPDLFYFRNVIPRHHGAQAGHDAVVFDSIPLEERFKAAMSPKAILHHPSGKQYLVYREGLPIHLISVIANKGGHYLDRPDVVVLEGSMEIRSAKSGIIEFEFESPSGGMSGSLRVKNDVNVPLKNLSMNLEGEIGISSIIECSVGKGRVKAEEQLERYLQLFKGAKNGFNVLVNGQQKKCPAFDHEIVLDISSTIPSTISSTFHDGFIALARFLDERLKPADNL